MKSSAMMSRIKEKANHFLPKSLIDMKKEIICTIAVVMAVAFVSSCQNKGKELTKDQVQQVETDSVEVVPAIEDDTEQDKSPEVVLALKRLTQCIVNGDARQLASLVYYYPFSRPYPLRDIKNKKQMIAYFDILFDDSIKNMLRRSSDKDWDNGGWRGYCFGNGLIWASPDSLEGVNYMSAKEKALYEKTIKKDIASIHPSLQEKGLRPFICYRDQTDGSIMRIDEDKEKYRLALYQRGTSLSGIPDVCIYGTMEIQGSMAIRCFTFKDSQTTYEFDDDSEELIISVSGEEKGRHNLRKCYWLDL